MAKSPASPASPVPPASAPSAPASVPAYSPQWASSEKPDPALAPRPRSGAEVTTAAPLRAADAPDAIGPGGDSPARQPGGVVDGGSTSERQEINFDDGEIHSGRGNGAATGGTAGAKGGDSGRLGPPSEQLSPSNQPREHDEP